MMTNQQGAIGNLTAEIRDSLIRATERVLGPRGRQILWEAEHPRLIDAILADVSDLIPIIGDWTEAARLKDAVQRGIPVAGRELSAALGEIPVVGPLLDALTPTETIAWLERRGYSVPEFPIALAQELGLRPPPSLERLLPPRR